MKNTDRRTNESREKHKVFFFLHQVRSCQDALNFLHTARFCGVAEKNREKKRKKKNEKPGEER